MRFFILSLLALIIMTSCEEDASDARLSVYLTDAPAEFEQVNIDLELIRVKMASDTTKFINLDTRAGIYDLLTLQNSTAILVAEDVVPEGDLVEVRFMLGLDNTVWVDGTEHHLLIPAGHHSGYPVALNERMESGKPESITIDFNAELSVSENPSGGYFFHPVLRQDK